MSKLTTIYEGSFNRPADKNLAITQSILVFLNGCDVLLMVSPQNAFKSRIGMAPLTDRLAMTKILTEGDKRLTATDIKRETATAETAEKFEKLLQLFPDRLLILVIGSDNMSQIHTWHNWEFIFDHFPVLVFLRPGGAQSALSSAAARYALKVDDPSLLASSSGCYMVPGEGYTVSATLQRKDLKNGRDAPHTPLLVRKYVQSHHLTF